MGTTGAKPAQLAAMVIFAFSCFGLLLFLWLSFGGPIPLKPKAYQVKVAFEEATTLAEQADIRVAGVSVGKVVSKELDPRGNGTLATLEIERKYAPIRKDAKAMLRQKTLLGETYVELQIGSKGAPKLAEGARLPDGQVEETVELDEVLEIFPKETRAAFRRWQANSAEVIEGHDRDLNDALGNLSGFANDGADLMEVLNRRRDSLQALVRETGTVFGALTRDEDALRAFIADTSTWFQATASEKEALAESIRIFPTFLRESRSTLTRLATFSKDTKPLIDDLGPVARDLRPTLLALQDASPSARRVFAALPPLIKESETGLPALSAVLRGLEPVLRETGPLLAQVNPLLQFLEMNNGKVSDFIAVGPSALAGKRASPNPGTQGHVLPQLITTGSQSILTPTRSEDNRGNSYQEPTALKADRYKDGYFIYPNWDCVPSKGERKADDENPGCYVQGPIPFQGENLRFPHVKEDMTPAVMGK